jgi:hypothetical protein
MDGREREQDYSAQETIPTRRDKVGQSIKEAHRSTELSQLLSDEKKKKTTAGADKTISG